MMSTVLSQTVTFIGSLVLMLVLNWRLTLLILGLTPVLVGSAAIFGARLRRLSTQVQDQLANLSALAEEAFNGIRVVKAFNREPFEVDRYHNQIEAAFQAMMRLTVIRSAFGPLVSFLGFATLAIILWFGGQKSWRVA